MKRRGLLPQVIAFFLTCIVGVLIALIGLRLYYNDARLQSALTRVYQGKSFQVLAGQAKVAKKDVLVNSLKPDGFSFINVGFLHLDSRFYERIVVNFAEIDARQSVLLAVRHRVEGREDMPVAEQRLRIQNRAAEVSMSELLPDNVIAIDVGLISDQLITPYRVSSITIVPKKLTNSEFLALLWDCFAINKQWENWSINTHKSPHWVLIPPKIFVFLIFAVVGVLFAMYLRIAGRHVINAWWATIVAAWFTLDAHYLVEKTVITKNTYDTFAHLSDDEKDLVLSPEPARLAQMIKSVLPDNGKRKNICVELDLGSNYTSSARSYYIGKMYYYLYPEFISRSCTKIPKEVWEQGGFYYVDGNKNKQLTYDVRQQKLVSPLKQSVFAKRLLHTDYSIYYVVGVKNRQKDKD